MNTHQKTLFKSLETLLLGDDVSKLQRDLEILYNYIDILESNGPENQYDIGFDIISLSIKIIEFQINEIKLDEWRLENYAQQK